MSLLLLWSLDVAFRSLGLGSPFYTISHAEDACTLGLAQADCRDGNGSELKVSSGCLSSYGHFQSSFSVSWVLHQPVRNTSIMSV